MAPKNKPAPPEHPIFTAMRVNPRGLIEATEQLLRELHDMAQLRADLDRDAELMEYRQEEADEREHEGEDE